MAALGHEIRPAVGDLHLQNGQWRLELRLSLETIIAQIDPGLQDTDESENAPEYDRLRALSPDALADQFDADSFAAGMRVVLDGVPSQVRVAAVRIDPVGDIALLRDSHLTLTGSLDEAAALQLGWDAQYGALILRLMDESGSFTAFLENGALSDPIPTSGMQTQTSWQILVNYIYVGFDHIVPKGLDHILFVIGLFLFSTRVGPLLWQVTAFTLAHSVTLALALFDVIRLDGSIVEPLIAASIIYIAIENTYVRRLTPWRPMVVFVFGLLHGLGFAGVLTEFGLPAGAMVPALVGFNIGVEVGQLAVILGCFLLVGFWFSRRPWYHRGIVVPGSVAIAMVGAYWLAERTVLA